MPRVYVARLRPASVDIIRRVFHRTLAFLRVIIFATRCGRRDSDAASAAGEEDTMKASIAIHVETLWTNRAELSVEAELDNPHSGTNQEVISMMFEVARMMTTEARGENERALFSQAAVNDRYRELDEREARLDERDKRVTSRETTAAERDTHADERERDANTRERDQMEHDVACESSRTQNHLNGPPCFDLVAGVT
jgi:hypothetical protein